MSPNSKIWVIGLRVWALRCRQQVASQCLGGFMARFAVQYGGIQEFERWALGDTNHSNSIPVAGI